MEVNALPPRRCSAALAELTQRFTNPTDLDAVLGAVTSAAVDLIAGVDFTKPAHPPIQGSYGPHAAPLSAAAAARAGGARIT